MMLLGYFLKTVHFADEAFFKKANTLVFKVFLPTLLFINVYDIESLAAVNWRAVIYTLLIVLVLCGAGLILTKLLFRTRSKIGPLCQCSFRSNYAIIGIPLAETLGGSAGATEDTLSISGTGLTGGTVNSHNDHRIAMAAAIAATVCSKPVTILGADAVNKSYPVFWKEYRNLGGNYEQYLR